MPRTTSRRPSASMVISVVALIVATGGTGYAAVTLSKNSVGSRELKPRAVHASDLASNAVTERNVKDGSLLSNDFKPGQLPAGIQGQAGAKGDAGVQGPKGDRGVQGDPGPTTASASHTGQPDPSGYNNDATQTITTPTSGKLWIEGVDSYTASTCTSGKYSVALFLDDVYVPGTRRDVPLAETAQAGTTETFGVANSVPAGLHTVALRGLLTNCSSSYGIDSVVGAIALG